MADKSKSTALGDVPFFNRLIGSAEGDPIVGEDELGNPIYLNQRTKVRYTLDKVGKKGDLTARGKASELVKQTKKWFKNPTVSFKPKAIAEGVKQVVEQTPSVARSVTESFDKTVKGKGTYGETFGLAAIPAAPISRVPEGALRTFGGMSSVRELVEKGKISLDEVEHVTSLIERGVRPETLWGETGRWFIGKDGQLRIELDDSAMKIKPAFYDNAPDRIRRNDTMGESDWLTTFELEDSLGEKLNYERLEDLIDHKELFDAYPSLKDMKVYLDGENRKRYKNTYGVYREGTDDIVLNLNRIGYEPDDIKETLIHEIQHAIQKRENFARGASPDSAIVKNHPEYKAAVDKVTKLEDEYSDLWKEKIGDPSELVGSVDLGKTDPDIFEPLNELFEKIDDAMLERDLLGFELYTRIYGEEEANAVMQRLHMTAGERAEQFPEFNYRGSRRGDKKPESIIHRVEEKPRGFAAGGYAYYSDPRMGEKGRTASPSQTQSRPSLSFGGSKAPSTSSVPTSRPTLSFNQPSKSSPTRSEPSYTPDRSYDPMSPSIPRGSKPSGDIAGAFGFKSPAASTTVSRPTVKTNGSNLLSYIRASEARGGYDTQTDYATKAGIKPPKALTSMLVSDVRDYQNLLSSKGVKSTAMGGYQVMGYTLQGLIDQGVVKPSDVFDKTTQDKIGMALLERRGLSKYQSGQMSESDFLKGLSQEWAAFPVTTKMVGHLGTMLNPGDSYYKGLAGNEATVSVNDFISAVRGIPKGQIPTLSTRPVPRPVIGMVGGVKKAGGHWQPFGSKGLAHQANLDYTDASQHLRKVSFDKGAIGPNAVYLGKRDGKDLWAAHDYERDEAGNYIAGSALKAANLASSIPGGTVATQAELANLYKNPLTQHIPMPLHPEGKTWDKATKAEYDRLLPSFDPTRPVVHGKEFYASEPEQLASARTSEDVRYASSRPQLTFPTVTRSTKTLPTPKETEATAPKVRPQPRPYEVRWEPRANPEAIAKAKAAILEKIPEEDKGSLFWIGMKPEDLAEGVEKALNSAADVEAFVKSKLGTITQRAAKLGRKKEFLKEDVDAIVDSVISTGLVGNKAVRIPGTEPKVTEQLPAKKPEPVYRRPQLPVKSKAPLVSPRPTARPKTEDDVPKWAKADWLREADKFLLSFIPDWMKGGELIKPRTEEPAERKTRKDLYCYHDQLSGEYICNYPDHEHENSVLPRMDYTPGASAFNEGGLVAPTFTGEYTNFGRPVWERNGNRYSEKSITIGVDDGFVVVPTVGPEGEDIPFDTILEYLDNYGLVDPVTGEKLPIFTSEATANKYAKERSDNMLNPIWEFKEEE